MNHTFISKKTIHIFSLFLVFLFFFGFLSLLQTNKELVRLSTGKQDAIEVTYKATSPKGLIGGVILPASCEANYYHPTGGAWPTPDGNSTNNGAATRLDYGWVRRLNDNGYCVRNDNGSSIFLNADHGNFVNGAPGVSKVTTGDL